MKQAHKSLLFFAAAAALLILPLVFFWPVSLGPRTLLPADNLLAV